MAEVPKLQEAILGRSEQDFLSQSLKIWVHNRESLKLCNMILMSQEFELGLISYEIVDDDVGILTSGDELGVVIREAKASHCRSVERKSVSLLKYLFRQVVDNDGARGEADREQILVDFQTRDVAMLSFFIVDFVLGLFRIEVYKADDLITPSNQIWHVVYFARCYICSV